MAKISTYPLDNNPSLNDRLIGSDAESGNATKNYSIFNVLNLIGDYYADAGTGPAGYVLTSNGEDTTPSWEPNPLSGYVPYEGATSDVNLGDNSLYAENVYATEFNGDAIYAVNLYENGNKLTSYASAISLVPQVQTNVGVAKIVEFETGLFSDTATVSGNLITFNAIGRYMIEVTARVEHTSGGGDAILNLWLQYTTGLIANTRQTFTVANAHTQEIKYSFLLSVGNPADAIRVYWSTSNLAARFSAISSVGIFPGAPSTLLNVYKVG